MGVPRPQTQRWGGGTPTPPFRLFRAAASSIAARAEYAVSRVLVALGKVGLVECLMPTDKKGRPRDHAARGFTG